MAKWIAALVAVLALPHASEGLASQPQPGNPKQSAQDMAKLKSRLLSGEGKATPTRKKSSPWTREQEGDTCDPYTGVGCSVADFRSAKDTRLFGRREEAQRMAQYEAAELAAKVAAAVVVEPVAPSGVYGEGAAGRIAAAKPLLLNLCEEAEQGRNKEKRAAVEAKIKELEAVNPNTNPLESPELTGTWRLVYTTSDSILGVSRARPFRPRPKILQSINAGTLTAKNEEWVLMGLLKNQVRAELEPRGDGRTVDVQFKKFGIGWLRIPAPKRARGVLETTYLDNTLRIGRGDKGNTFVLVKDNAKPRVK